MNIEKHKSYMLRILRDIFTDKMLSQLLAFKGGTALMFFYQLPRFSVDLDFNLLDESRAGTVFEKLKKIVTRYGKIHDSAHKFYGLLLVLDYGANERMLKIEVSFRKFDDHYERKSLIGIPVQILKIEDMMAHKFCALCDRTEVAGRDVFDCWFFLKNNYTMNAKIVEERMGKPLKNYLDNCILTVENFPEKQIIYNVGELIDVKMKNFVKTKLRAELLDFLRFYQALL